MFRLISTILISLLLVSCSPKPQSCPLPQEIRQTSYQELEPQYQELLDAGQAVLKNSYNPYSKFFVGAAVLAEDGTIISGTNFENAAYGSTICAERAAILRANSMGYRKLQAIAIIGHGRNSIMTEPIAPCGACRQVIHEISDLQENSMTVIMSNTKKDVILITSIDRLLPLAFGPKALKS